MTTNNSRLLTRLALIPLAVAMVLGAFSSPAQAQKIRPDFFGMHDSNLANGGVPTVKLGSIRLWDTGTTWRQIEPTQGAPFDWSRVDAAVNTARAAGLKPLLVLGQTPEFHAEDPASPGAFGPGANSMPRLEAWKNYVTEVAKRFDTKVEYQIWNEPNVNNYWIGSMREMAVLTATASRIIRKVTGAVGRKATVVAPGFPLRLEGQREKFKKYWAQKFNGSGMASYVDVVGVHLYPEADQAPEASLKLLKFARGALPKAARSKPIWDGEINYGLIGMCCAEPISSAKQAAFVARTLLLNAGSGIRRVYWYSWAQGALANTNLVEDDRVTLTRGGRAWQRVHRWIAGTDMKGCARKATGRLKGLYTCTARESSTEVRRFYWKPAGAAVNITTPRSTRSYTTLSGNRTVKKGSFRIKVGKTPIMVTSRS